MTTYEKAEFIRKNRLEILDMWCPDCNGPIVDFPAWKDNRPLLCLDCGMRLTYAEPVAWPGSTIKALDWSRAVWQVDEERRVYLMADVVDQVLGRLDFTGGE